MTENYTILSFTEKCPLRCAVRHIGSIEPHVQDFFELDMILSGRCQASVGEQVYSLRAPDVLSIEAHLPILHRNRMNRFSRPVRQPFRAQSPNPRHRISVQQPPSPETGAAFDSLRRRLKGL